MKTIFQEWTEYEQMLIELGAPPMQRYECKKAFYLGASLCLEVAGPDKEFMLAVMYVEVREFMAHLQADITASSSAV